MFHVRAALSRRVKEPFLPLCRGPHPVTSLTAFSLCVCLHVWCKVVFSKCLLIGAALVAQRLKRLPAMQKTWVQSPCWEDPLEKEMATHSSILAWRIPRTEGLVGGVAKSQTRLSDFTYLT